ncbi:MAG TPA: MerR family transcriptional regulator [Puia sp.]|uniref:MerR family transcriptional regulator n=1 Tax=Puia sp. TaxID=2045100 RepID=UPI002C3980AD|nr:MerR family transcriptional regulator [Puia sp.]HVU98974.1 MerR family transcriptional regulator [Puia sp.]
MSSNLTQIALDFGSEPQPVPPSAEEAARPYLAADGVGVRVKSFKQPAVPAVAPEIAVRPIEKVVNGDLFAVEEAAPVVVKEPVAVREPVVVEAPVAAVEEPVAQVPEVLPKTRRRTPAGRTSAAKPGTSKRGRKSLKEVAAEAQLIEIPADEVLFSKQYYTMGEVSEMFRVNQSLLRFWETEFDILQPKKNKKGDRYFRPVDIKNLHLIYHLLRQKKYTIEGAKEFLKKNKKAEDGFEVIQRLQKIKAFLVEWKAQL